MDAVELRRQRELFGSSQRPGRRISMGDLLQPWHLIIIAIVAIVLFGGKKLPELGKGLGEGLKGFKDGLKGVADEAPVAKSTPVVPAETGPASIAKEEIHKS
jgi:sec-independent protein translocase protein TatA